MPLCAKCHQKEATIHFTTIVVEEEEERGTVHLCMECAGPVRLEDLQEQAIETLSVAGKKCEFCGKDAFFAEVSIRGSPVFCCYDCGLEFGRIVGELMVAEQPELRQKSMEEILFVCIDSASDIAAWSEEAMRKAVQILKERRHRE